MPAPNPDHLLDQAERLIIPVGPGAPRQADLRRAISNTYYAAFHAVVTEAVDDIVGKTKRNSSRYGLVYRSVDHRAIRRLCENAGKEKLPDRYVDHVPSGGFGDDLQAFAAVVVDLQEKRHVADYDPLFRARTADAVLAIATCRNALQRFKNASRSRRKAFVSLILFSPR